MLVAFLDLTHAFYVQQGIICGNITYCEDYNCAVECFVLSDLIQQLKGKNPGSIGYIYIFVFESVLRLEILCIAIMHMECVKGAIFVCKLYRKCIHPYFDNM